MPTTKVSSTTSTLENGDGTEREVTQYRTTIPKQLAEALDLDGATVEWQVESGSKLSLRKVDD